MEGERGRGGKGVERKGKKVKKGESDERGEKGKSRVQESESENDHFAKKIFLLYWSSPIMQVFLKPLETELSFE